jgi:uncharacterized protein (DUF1697 family)
MCYVALLRGVNVGGHAKVAMPELRRLLGESGFCAVRTHLNSGNVVFTAPPEDESLIAARLEQIIADHFGLTVRCLVRGGDYLRAVMAANPFPGQAADGKIVHATFLSGRVGPDQLAALDAVTFAPDEYRLGDRVIYLHLPGGLGRSKLAESLARPAVLKGVTATTRNWNTVTRLAEMAVG